MAADESCPPERRAASPRVTVKEAARLAPETDKGAGGNGSLARELAPNGGGGVSNPETRLSKSAGVHGGLKGSGNGDGSANPGRVISDDSPDDAPMAGRPATVPAPGVRGRSSSEHSRAQSAAADDEGAGGKGPVSMPGSAKSGPEATILADDDGSRGGRVEKRLSPSLSKDPPLSERNSRSAKERAGNSSDHAVDKVESKRLSRSRRRHSRDAHSSSRSRSPRRSARRSRDDSDLDESRDRRGRRRRRRRRRYSDDEDEDDREYRRRKRRRRHRGRSYSRSPKRSASEERERERRREERRARRREREEDRRSRKARKWRGDRDGWRDPDEVHLTKEERERNTDRESRRERSRYDYDDDRRTSYHRRSRRGYRREDSRERLVSVGEDEMRHESRDRQQSRTNREVHNRDEPSRAESYAGRDGRLRRDNRRSEERTDTYGARDKSGIHAGFGSYPAYPSSRRLEEPSRGGRNEDSRRAPNGGDHTRGPGWTQRYSSMRPGVKEPFVSNTKGHTRKESVVARLGSRLSSRQTADTTTEVPPAEHVAARGSPDRKSMPNTPWDSDKQSSEIPVAPKPSVKAKVQAQLNSWKLDRLRMRALASMAKKRVSKETDQGHLPDSAK